MSTYPRRIAVLFHSMDDQDDLASYIVHHLAECWREDGHEVIYLFGSRRFVPADVVLVHVNLSVVPDEYLDFAARYPLVLNGGIKDIRKSVTSSNLLRRDDPWDGPVIVKSDLNFAGEAERVLTRSWLERRFRPWGVVNRIAASARGKGAPFVDWREYQLFDRLADVPEHWFHHPEVVVERFRPELEDGVYHLRMFQFLGDRWSCTRLASPDPLLKAETSIRVEQTEPHAEVFAWREQFGMDFGKLDYVVNAGEPVLLDVNKTTGASRHMADDELRAIRRDQAEGLYSYFS
jgi:hypothetical protein